MFFETPVVRMDAIQPGKVYRFSSKRAFAVRARSTLRVPGCSGMMVPKHG